MIMRAEKNREIQALEISTAARVAREEGEIAGEIRGERKRRIEEKKETALSLLKIDLSLDEISMVTGLTLSAIEKLREANEQR